MSDLITGLGLGVQSNQVPKAPLVSSWLLLGLISLCPVGSSAESGPDFIRQVPFIHIYHEGWDSQMDQRGRLDDTLVSWGGESGRTPMVETNPALGRTLGRVVREIPA